MKTTVGFLVTMALLGFLMSCSFAVDISNTTKKNLRPSDIKSYDEVETYSTSSEDDLNKIHMEGDVYSQSKSGTKETFNANFKKCKPDTLRISLMENIVYFYEIIGPKNGFCEVKSKFLENPNPAWVGKEMIGLYDPKMVFEEAVQD